MVLGVLLFAAMLTHSIPARHFSHLEHARANGNHAGHESGQHDALCRHRDLNLLYALRQPPQDITAGTPVEMTVHIEDRNGKPLKGLTVHHERILHAVIIGSDSERLCAYTPRRHRPCHR